MNEYDIPPLRIMGHFSCENIDIKIDDTHNKNKSVICIGQSPSYNYENSQKDIDASKKYFSDCIEMFIWNIYKRFW